MALMFRLCSRQTFSNLVRKDLNRLSFARPVTMKSTPYQPPAQEGYDEHNMKLKRPLSPHLTIYAPQLTSMLSISHRITGLALTGYAVALGVGALVLPQDIPTYLDSLQAANIGVVPISILKFSVAFPLAYHFWNGLRHLIWDSGKCLTIREVYSTGYLVSILSVVSSVALTCM